MASSTGESADIYSITSYFDDLVNTNLGNAVADKAEDVRSDLYAALSELSKAAPDTDAARSNIEGAQTDLQAMIDAGLIDSATGSTLINRLQTILSQP